MPSANSAQTSVSGRAPVLLEAINLTMRTIETRSRLYRNLVVCVVITVAGAVMLATFTTNWIPLCGGLLLPVYVACFLAFDNRIVTRWQGLLFQLRDERGLRLQELEHLLSGFQHLPQATLRSMLRMLQRVEKHQ